MYNNQDDATLVAPDNQSNSIVNSNQKINLNKTIPSSIVTSVSSESNDNSNEQFNNDSNSLNKKTNSIEQSNQNDNLQNKQMKNETDNVINDDVINDNVKDDNVKDDSNDQTSDVDSNAKENETINKLGLNLDYYPQINLSELEQSITSINSLTSTQKSETSSIHSSNSRTNSPTRSTNSNRSLPIKRINTSEISLIVHEYDNQHSKDDQIRYLKIERKNLMHLASLIINNLINNISPLTRTLECHNNIVLYDFFSITEQILKHGLKARKGLIFGKKELWNVFESIENINAQIIEIIQNIRELPNIKTNNGRVKAFLRLTFVHKVFNEIFSYLVNSKELLKSFYEEGAFILSNEIDEFLEKTHQLKDFDFRWCAKDDVLDSMSNLIDLTNYLVDKERTTKEIVYKLNINKNQLKELIEERLFYENKSKEFRNKILFYYNRIKELGIEQLFEIDSMKSPSKIELLTKKLNEIFKSPVEKLVISEQNPDVVSLQEDIATLKKQLEIELSNRVSKEAALEYIESDVLVKQDENIVMRHQIEEVRQLNEDLCLKVGELGQLNSELNAKIITLTNKNQQLVQTVTELQRNLVATEAKHCQMTTSEKSFKKQNEELQDLIESLKSTITELQTEKTGLQKKLDDNIERSSTVLTELNIANNRANEYKDLKKKHDILLRRCGEYEQTLFEIGEKLSNAQLEIDSLKEQTIPFSDATWINDEEAKNCEGCNVLFSIKTRKHHCRNCGRIFCNKCSDRKIPLPANSKPCRVCDACCDKLLGRYNG